MRIDTVKGCSYVVTCTGACTVQVLRSDESPITIVEAAKAGQYVFVAPTDAVEVSDEHALVTQTFKAAASGSSARGGIQPGDDATLKSLMAESATFAGTVNANGGINIPLAVGAATDTTGINRAHALGLVHTAMMHQVRTYWLTSSCTATNGVTINHVAPGCYAEARVLSNISTSLTLPTAGAIGGGDYSKIMGYSIPIRHDGGYGDIWFKVSMRLGIGGQWTEFPDAGRDGYRFRPVAGSAPSIERLVEVTIYYQDGYKARVRELIGIGNPRQYVVRTTDSRLNYNNNTNPCSAAYRVVIAQSEQSYTDALAASVWLVMGGASNDTVIKLADIRGWDTYRTSVTPTLYVDTQSSGLVRLESPTVLNGIGGNTYVRYGLEPYQRSWITTETEVPYTDPEQPTE